MVIHTRRSALSIRLIRPQTIIDILKIKLHIGNKRNSWNATDAVMVQEDMIQIEAGWNRIIGKNLSMKYWTTAWIDKVSECLWKRNLELLSPKVKRFYKTINKTLMDYAIEYAKNRLNERDTLFQINYIRLKKGIVFPFKVIGFDGTQRTKCYQQIDELIPVK